MSRSNNKKILLENSGKVCYTCGEGREAALHFHHIDPSTKDRSIKDLYSLAIHRSLQETKKCALLCATCHNLIHANDLETTYRLYRYLKR